eukprot:6214315-Pleurochrysis_carterae.AAC.2
MSKVFDDIERWVFVDRVETPTYRARWEALRAWHTAYRTSNSITVGIMQDGVPEKGLHIGGCPVMPLRATAATSSTDAAPAAASAATSTAPLHRKLRGNELRQALSSATQTSDLNVRMQGKLTLTRAACVCERTHLLMCKTSCRCVSIPTGGIMLSFLSCASHCNASINMHLTPYNFNPHNLSGPCQVRDDLFFVRLEECEGEFPLGLAGSAHLSRCGERSRAWSSPSPLSVAQVDGALVGLNACFQVRVCLFTNRRRSLPWLGTIAVSNIIAIPVVLTPNSVGNAAEPVLSRDCMSFVRSHMQALADNGEWVPDGEDEGLDEEEESEKKVEADSSDEGVSAVPSRASRARAANSVVVDSSDEDAPRLTPHALRSGAGRTAVERKRRRSARS